MPQQLPPTRIRLDLSKFMSKNVVLAQMPTEVVMPIILVAVALLDAAVAACKVDDPEARPTFQRTQDVAAIFNPEAESLVQLPPKDAANPKLPEASAHSKQHLSAACSSD